MGSVVVMYEDVPDKKIILSFFSKQMGPEDPANRKKHLQILFQPICRNLQDDYKNVSLKIGSKGPKKLGHFFSLFLMIKPLSSGQKWFLRTYFPLIGVCMYSEVVFVSGTALEVPEPRVRKRSS